MKKHITKLSMVLLMLTALVVPKRSVACIDFATQVWVTCEYEKDQTTQDITQVIIRVHNLRLFGGNPNHFCSCAVNSYTTFFSDIQYVAFVDSGKDTPIDGFLPFEKSTLANSAWESVWASGDWSGFVAGVSQAGLLPGKPVELIIRATPPPGFKVTGVKDSVFQYSTLGTDEWDNANNDLANSHQNIIGLTTGGATIMVEKDAAYFAAFDKAMRTALSVKNVKANQVNIYPNPSNGIFNIKLLVNETIEHIEIYNSSGQVVKRLEGNRETFNLNDQSPGVYLIRVRTNGALYQQRITLL